MKTTQSQYLAAFALLSSVASAVPVVRLAIREAQPQSYSVVAVDGGSSTPAAAAPPATKTVTDAVTQVQTATILSTIQASASDSPASVATQVIPQTVTLATTIVETPAASAATVTIGPSVTSVPFDNGQWHTTYYFKSTVTPSAEVKAAAVSSSSAAAPTTMVDPGQWAAWSEKGAGQ